MDDFERCDESPACSAAVDCADHEMAIPMLVLSCAVADEYHISISNDEAEVCMAAFDEVMFDRNTGETFVPHVLKLPRMKQLFSLDSFTKHNARFVIWVGSERWGSMNSSTERLL